MARVQRGNVILDVEDENVSYYTGLGYDVTDNSGNILVAAVPQDVASLQKAFRDHKNQIEGLKQKISDLEAKLQTYVQDEAKPKKKAVKSED